MKRELIFLFALWKANLLAAMEFRAAFVTQVAGMMLNNAMYFLFWIVFFNRFKEIRGWQLGDMFVLFGLVAASFGLGAYLFGNVMTLSDTIASGKLDYFLSLPRAVLPHVLASRSIASGMGDFLYGVLSFLAATWFGGQLTLDMLARFVLAVSFSTTVIISFLVLVQSLAFWLGGAQLLGQQAVNAILTFSIYPITLFDNTAKLLLLTVIPAALVGAVPAEFVRSFSWERLALMAGGGTVLLVLAVWVFYRGLRRYESGSGIQVQS